MHGRIRCMLAEFISMSARNSLHARAEHICSAQGAIAAEPTSTGMRAFHTSASVSIAHSLEGRLGPPAPPGPRGTAIFAYLAYLVDLQGEGTESAENHGLDMLAEFMLACLQNSFACLQNSFACLQNSFAEPCTARCSSRKLRSRTSSRASRLGCARRAPGPSATSRTWPGDLRVAC